jgi:D-serine deaminase-like pyridoxal phosphate-dependent protein
MSRWHIGRPKAELDTPALCLDIEVVERNVRRMAAYLAQTGVRLRPQSKTHKSPALAHLQIEAGAIGITCAKLGETKVMAAGLKDILIAHQIVGADKIARLVNLAAYTEVMVAVDNPGNAAELARRAREGCSSARPF